MSSWHSNTGGSPRGQSPSLRVLSLASLWTESNLPTPSFLPSTKVMSKSHLVDGPAGWAQTFSSHSVGGTVSPPMMGGDLCVSRNTVYTFWKAGQRKGGHSCSSPCQKHLLPLSAISFLCLAHPPVSMKINSLKGTDLDRLTLCAKPRAFPPLFFFRKCSNLHKSYKNSTMSTHDLDSPVNIGHFCFLSLNMYVLINHYSGAKAPKTLPCPLARKRTFCCVIHYCHQS